MIEAELDDEVARGCDVGRTYVWRSIGTEAALLAETGGTSPSVDVGFLLGGLRMELALGLFAPSLLTDPLAGAVDVAGGGARPNPSGRCFFLGLRKSISSSELSSSRGCFLVRWGGKGEELGGADDGMRSRSTSMWEAADGEDAVTTVEGGKRRSFESAGASWRNWRRGESWRRA